MKINQLITLVYDTVFILPTFAVNPTI